MGYTEALSFLVPPFPFFIEGNVTTYRPGEQHPNRYRLGYFDVILVKEGTLYLGEEDCMWTMYSNHALILEPDKHHFPVKPCHENTSFYWFHFQTNNSWLCQTEPQMIIPKEPVSKLHYYAEHTTIHLPKYQQIVNSGELFEMLDLLLSTTLKPRKLALWETQQTFMKVLQGLENNQNHKDSSTQLAEQIEIYLKQNYKTPITNKQL
ncbi:helix-turn-helix transcriptional regulator [Paenibacillus sp. QZ-Y1]|uniref:helix-turn-helix transcriptional regulator n=1 Tax=Paenibacillus sp. QZ-Y1 TaxID=3414511 RepID=UPI003F79F9AF